MKVAVVGAGVSGLSSAHYLRKLCGNSSIPLELVLFESSSGAGGVVRTVNEGDTVLELGPDSFITSKPWALDLVRELELEDSLVGVGDGGRKTFVFAEGRLRPLPDGFFMMAPSRLSSFLRSDLFSVRTKLRVLLEPLVARGDGEDESVGDFVKRRFGKKILDIAAQPILGGIYMADVDGLSLSSTAPQFLEMEKRNGSVLLSLLRDPLMSRGESGARYGLFLTPARGMTVIVEKLLESADFSRLNFGTEVRSLERAGRKWLLGSRLGVEEFDSVILAVSASSASFLLDGPDSRLAADLSRVRYSSSVVTVCVFDEKNFSDLPDGFGVIVPRTAKMNLAACSLYSRKFPGKCAGGKVVIRGFLGGEENPAAVGWSDDKVKAVVEEEFSRIFGSANAAEKIIVSRYPGSMPVFRVGHSRAMAGIMDAVSRVEGLSLCGAAYMGVGIPDCVRSGQLAAEKIYRDTLAKQ